jgi:hypothetical protein
MFQTKPSLDSSASGMTWQYHPCFELEVGFVATVWYCAPGTLVARWFCFIAFDSSRLANDVSCRMKVNQAFNTQVKNHYWAQMIHMKTSMPFECVCLEISTLFEPLEVDHTNDGVMTFREPSRMKLE